MRTKMEITVGSIKLTAKSVGRFGANKSTIIIIHDSNNHVFEVDANDLRTAIEALEKTCWRP